MLKYVEVKLADKLPVLLNKVNYAWKKPNDWRENLTTSIFEKKEKDDRKTHRRIFH